jgi:hypothetical protein
LHAKIAGIAKESKLENQTLSPQDTDEHGGDQDIRTSGDRDIGKTAVGRESEVAIGIPPLQQAQGSDFRKS